MASILITENDPLIGADLCAFLIREGQEAQCVLDCPETMRCLSSCPPLEVSILDPQGQEMASCVELMVALVRLSIPVIVWTLIPNAECLSELKALNLPLVVFAPGVPYKDILVAIFQNTPQPDPTKPN